MSTFKQSIQYIQDALTKVYSASSLKDQTKWDAQGNVLMTATSRSTNSTLVVRVATVGKLTGNELEAAINEIKSNLSSTATVEVNDDPKYSKYTVLTITF